MKERGATQTSVCVRLSLSPVYFSMWLRHKDIPKSTAALYTVHGHPQPGPQPDPQPDPRPSPNRDPRQAALEQWLDDPAVFIRHARITNTNPAQVPRPPKGASGDAHPKKRGRPANRKQARWWTLPSLRTTPTHHSPPPASGEARVTRRVLLCAASPLTALCPPLTALCPPSHRPLTALASPEGQAKG